MSPRSLCAMPVATMSTALRCAFDSPFACLTSPDLSVTAPAFAGRANRTSKPSVHAGVCLHADTTGSHYGGENAECKAFFRCDPLRPPARPRLRAARRPADPALPIRAHLRHAPPARPLLAARRAGRARRPRGTAAPRQDLLAGAVGPRGA